MHYQELNAGKLFKVGTCIFNIKSLQKSISTVSLIRSSNIIV